MKKHIANLYEMRHFLLLFLTQTFSALGSGVTGYSLVIWSYRQAGSALATSLLMVCSYAPYVLLSLFAGALSDRWNKKRTMLVCDSLAALTTVAVLVLFKTGTLRIWHLYLINAVNGLMNTVQQPASEVATTLLLPERSYQRVGGIRYLGSSVNAILQPVIATAMLGLLGLDAVIAFDLVTFAVAFVALLLFIPIPERETETRENRQSLWRSAMEGVGYLKDHLGIFHLMLFLAAINLVASMYEAAMPAMLLSRAGGGEVVMGTVNTVVGVTMLASSVTAALIPAPKSRVRVICNALLFSMSTENFLLAFGRNVWVWSLGGFLGWVAIPIMNTNLDAVMRLNIPGEIQGRVYAARNSFQFFTIPVGYLLGGLCVERIFEPLMEAQRPGSLLTLLLGTGKGTGAGLFFAVLALCGIAVCLLFRADRHLWELERTRE